MNIAVGAKRTKPGSKATARNGIKTRVPVGTLHAIDLDNQSLSASFDAMCGESTLMSIDGSWDDNWQNEKCEECEECMWAKNFAHMQTKLLN